MMIKISTKLASLVFLILIISACNKSSSIEVHTLTVEYLNNPIGIDRKSPLLSWKMSSDERAKSQSAYQILVASSDTLLTDVDADIWNSAKVSSSQNMNIRFTKVKLKAFQEYFWKVRIWDETGKVSAWSQPSFFETGPLDSKDWEASWISNKYAEVSDRREPFSLYDDTRTFNSADSLAVYMRKEFETKKTISKATVYVSGLGYYELYLNGKKIGDRVLDPVFTDYQRTVKYAAYDVTKDLKNNVNHTIGIVLGNGFYNHTERDLFQMEKANWKTPPKLMCQLRIQYENGETETFVSDSSWKWSYGPIVYNSIRGGETIDARIDIEGWNAMVFDPSQWKEVQQVPAPLGKLSYQYMPPLRETMSFKPDSTWSPKENITVFDFGENITGYADIEIAGESGTLVDIFFNEVLNPDGTLNVKHSSGHTWGRFQHGKLILSKKEADTFSPRFTYHGFRYVQVEGVPTEAIKSIEAKSVHTDLQEIGTFESSNKRLNQLHAAVKRTLLNSVHSMPGEEATREKMGWTYDGGMNTMESYLYNFDAINTYKKYLKDHIDAQGPTGHVPPIIPTNGWGFLEKTKAQKDTTIQYDDPWWGGTIAYVAQELFENTGDTTIIKEAYEPVKQYTDFVMSTAQDDIVYWSLGDWLDLTHGSKGWGPGLTPVELTSTAANHYLCEITAKHASMLGKQEDAVAYTNHAKRIKKAFNNRFLDRETGWYGNRSQTGQAVALFYGLVPEQMKEKAVERLLEAIRDNDYHTSVGFIGVRPLIQYLSEHGYKDIMYRMVLQEESPGWLHFVEDERSTMGENLNAAGYGTNHHPFATNIGFWLYEHLGGIKIDYSNKQEITLQPGLETDLDWVKTSCNSLQGTIVSDWENKNNEVYYHIEIPVNTEALLKLPEEFTIQNAANYDTWIKPLPDANRFEITSGVYDLVLRMKEE
ncbi:family 78 glycoside hydrolase catalytic domain [Flagellimonas meridianipacifica]|uniref:alpha-L-rhamnosidase n=1 Tax=Flagellimonas meridianipacifica TaxID=1080225 RepID=A0A2T0M8J9_9FLAO|nr:family 78 glycoside hydrolase catalytic domain [Allomuricauda pacifica]PRX53798.1 alpha-L-rhamnosidase [Allomuricauda pacifica]